MKILARVSVFWSRLRDSPRRAKVIAVVSGAILVASPVVYFWRDVTNTFTGASRRLDAAAKVEVTRTPLTKPNSGGIALMLNRRRVRGVAEFRGKRYAATAGGLAALGVEGGIEQTYTVLDGLPENDLQAIASYQDRLYLGTAHSGLIAFDGARFTQFDFKQPVARRITVLLATPAELLIGTFDGGLFEFDGQTFTRRYQATKDADFKSVTAIAVRDSRVCIGTHDQGLYLWREGRIDRITRTEGLPSNRITSIVSSARGLLVATDFGVVEIDGENRVREFNSTPNVTSLIEREGRYYAGLLANGIVELQRSQRPVPVGTWQRNPLSSGFSARESAPPHDVRLIGSPGGVWVATANGLYRMEGRSVRPFALQLTEDQLEHQHVTTLAFDWAGRLWVGYFDGGVDVVNPETFERFTHFGDDSLREVNFLRLDAERERMLVATSAGLVVFNSRLEPKRLGERDGLIGDSVSHIELASDGGWPKAAAASGQSVVISTGKGLTMLDGSIPRSLSAFNGLASNYIYTTLAARGRLYIGTLGGLTELERGRVTRTYTTSNSRIAANWITALASVDGTLFVGMNSGGVQALTPTGEWIDFQDRIGRFDVNPNAMLYDGNRLLVGTLDRGVMVFDSRTREWSSFTRGLGSKNVTAIAAGSGYFYFGTANGITRVDRQALDQEF